MLKSNFAKLAFVLFIGALPAACSSSDQRSLVVLDLQLGAGVSAPDSIHLVATASGTTDEVRAADVSWSNPSKSTMQIGLFIPSGVAGPVDIIAQAIRGNIPIAAGSLASVALKVGGTVGPHTLVLDLSVVGPAGDDAGVDGGGSVPVGIDAGVPDTTISDAPGADTTLPQDTGVRDGSTRDVSLSADAADAPPARLDADAVDTNPAQPDGSAVGPDAADASEAGHVPAWEPGQNVEGDIINSSFYPVVVVEPISENVYVAWIESAAIKVKRWNRTLGAWEQTITVENRGGPQSVQIGADAKGNVLLVWCQNTRGVDTALDGVWASRTTDGLSWSPPVRFGSTGAWGAQLAVARNGTAHVAYSKQGASSWPLFTAYYDGTAWAENPTPLDPNTTYEDSLPIVVVSATGDGMVVFWQNSGAAGSILTGPTVTTPVMLDPNYATTSPGDWGVAMNRKGEGIFVWSESTGPSMVMLARTYNLSTGWSSVSPPIVTSGEIFSVAVAMDEQNNLTIVWQQPLSTGGQNMMGIHGSLTGTWSDITPLETDNVASYLTIEFGYPKVAIDANGDVLAVWRKDLSTSTTTTYGAYASRFTGGTWLAQTPLGLKTGLEVPEINLSVADSGFGAASFYFRSDDPTNDPDAYNAYVAFFR